MVTQASSASRATTASAFDRVYEEADDLAFLRRVRDRRMRGVDRSLG
jgi:hypothetical protein